MSDSGDTTYSGEPEQPHNQIDDLTEDDMLDQKIYDKLYSIAERTVREALKQKLIKKAKEFGMALSVRDMLNAYEKDLKDRQKSEEEKKEYSVQSVNEYTNYTFDGEYDLGNMWCGNWQADDYGIYTMESSRPKELACYHPIMPVSRLKNMETGEEQIELAWKRNGFWQKKKFPKEAVVSARTIVGLAKYGISVTSETAKLLVRFLADVENGNEKYIPVGRSSSKLGWHGIDFLPYDSDIIFDGELRFADLFRSIPQDGVGDFDTWLNLMRKIRASGAIEPRMALAASFASPLIKMLDALPFIVDLNGQTEGGKTVCLMVAASVWANPDEHMYIGDFKSTNVALETRADMLNSLPLILDDSSKASPSIRDNFEGVVYDLCSGKGKSRSNKDLGANREYTWTNTIICNGEKPLSYYVDQGGAINRIIEVECNEHIFDDPRQVANIVKRNYGFAGRMFVDSIRDMSKQEIEEVRAKLEDMLTGPQTMQKQTLAMSILLVADKLATHCIFKDGNSLQPDDVKHLLTSRAEISENMRCYAMLMDALDEYGQHFDAEVATDQWGVIDEDAGWVYFIPNSFDRLLEKNGYSRKAFTRWAKSNKLLKNEDGRDTFVKKINGTPKRCICLRIISDYESMFDDQFEAIEDASLFNE